MLIENPINLINNFHLEYLNNNTLYCFSFLNSTYKFHNQIDFQNAIDKIDSLIKDYCDGKISYYYLNDFKLV